MAMTDAQQATLAALDLVARSRGAHVEKVDYVGGERREVRVHVWRTHSPRARVLVRENGRITGAWDPEYMTEGARRVLDGTDVLCLDKLERNALTMAVQYAHVNGLATDLDGERPLPGSDGRGAATAEGLDRLAARLGAVANRPVEG